jgi:hypothetical protein
MASSFLRVEQIPSSSGAIAKAGGSIKVMGIRAFASTPLGAYQSA